MFLDELIQNHKSDKTLPYTNEIHPTAIIHPGAKIARNVSIGPYSVIGENAEIGEGTTIASHVTIEGWTTIGESNQIGIGTIIGGNPQDMKFKGEKSQVIIGKDNIIREYVTINRGTEGGGRITSIGNNNVILTYSHVAHDVMIGNHNIISNSVAIAGHVVIEDWVTLGGSCGLHQFVRLGRMSMIGALSLITKDVLPYALVSGNPAKRYGLNIERLKRSCYSTDERNAIKRAYKILFNQGLSTREAINQLQIEFRDNINVNYIIKFLEESNRGFYR